MSEMIPAFYQQFSLTILVKVPFRFRATYSIIKLKFSYI